MASGFASRIAIACIGVVSLGVSVRALGDVRFGIVATLSTFLGMLSFTDLGMGNALMTQLAVADGKNDLRKARQAVSVAFAGMLIAGALVAALGVLVALNFSWDRLLGVPPTHLEDLRTTLIVFAVLAGASIPANIGQRVSLGLQEGLFTNVWLMASALGSLAGVLIAAGLGLPIWSYIVATVGVPAGISALQSILVFSRRHPALSPKGALVTWDAFASLTKLSALFLTLGVAVAVAYQTDMIIVSYTLGAAAAAKFAIATRLFTLVTSTLTGASQQLWTSIAEALSSGDFQWVESRFLKAVRLTLVASTLGATAVALIGQPFIKVWAGESLVPPRLLLVAYAVWTVYSIFMSQLSYLLNAAQVVRAQVVMALLMTALNLPLSLLLTQRIGIAGPILGSLTAHLAVSGIPAIVIARRELNRRKCNEDTRC
jgi:O-antigen/teichoic acid export membrane protein